jgi:hypothetical protein
MKINPLPPIEMLRELLSYDPDAGVIVWRVNRRGGVKAGAVAGDTDPTRKYNRIKINGKKYNIHRIAYALHHGIDPGTLDIDHINRTRADNRILNLRAVTRSENLKNKDHHNRPPLNDTVRAVLRAQSDKNKKKVIITYPDGRIVTTNSVIEAAHVVNRSHSSMCEHLQGRRKKNYLLINGERVKVAYA